MKYLFFLLVALSFLTCSGTTAPVFSQTEGTNREEVFTLGEIVVQGKKEGVEAIGTVHEIDAREIQDSGARNLNEALDLLPGVNVMIGGDAVPKIDIRGFRPRHNILLLDGIPINSTYDQQFNPSIIPVENIAEIKLTSGASSVLYGQGGLGGVINIITKKGTSGIKGMVGGEVGEGASHLGKSSVSGGGEKYNYFVSASTYERNAYPLSSDYDDTFQEAGDYRDNSDKKNSAFFLNYGYDFSKQLSAAVTFNYLFGEYGIPLPSRAPDTDGDGDIDDFYAPTRKYERMDDFEGFSFQLAGDYHPEASNFSLRGWAFYNEMDEEHNRYSDAGYNSFSSDPLNITFNLDNTATVRGLSLQPKYFFGDKAMLTLALSGELDSWESGGQAWNVWSSGWPPGYVAQDVEKDKDVGIYSSSLEYEYSPIPKLGLVAGAGLHYQKRDDISAHEILVNPNLNTIEPEDSDYNHSILFGAHYDLTRSTRFKTAFQRNVRFPSIRQLYDEDAGNPSLDTERVYHYTAGVEQKLPRNIRLTLDGYYSVARDFIEKDSRRSELFQNFDKYVFTGAELTLDIRTIERLMLRTSYSLLHATDESDYEQESDIRDELPYRPEHRISVEAKYDFPFGFTPYASLLYVANQYYYTKGGIWIDPDDGSWQNNANYPPKQAELHDYMVINLKLNQKICRDTVTLYAGVDNLLDEDYEQSYGYPLAGRYLYSGFEVRF